MGNIFDGGLWNLKISTILGYFSLAIIPISPCFAQSNIVPDNTLGTESSKVITNFNNRDIELIEGGVERGQNLFHSLREFNVNEGRGAYFLVPNNTIQNILTRVTGNNRSEILGILGTMSDKNFTPSSTNLFLINPNGILFGRNARLDINGSFVGTTANTLEFGEQGFFSATNPQVPSGLLTISPSAFLFNQINAQGSIQSSSINNLQVSNGKSLFLLGGNVNIDGGGEGRGISALGGRVELGGLASVGRVRLNVEDSQGLQKLASLNFPDNIERADVSLSNRASVNVTDSGGGDITINARNVNIIEGSQLLAGIAPNLGSPGTQAGNIKIYATGLVLTDGVLNGFHSSVLNQAEANSTGNSGMIEINAGSVEVKNGGQFNTGTLGRGNAGKIQITAKDKVIFDGAPLGLRSSAFSQVGNNAVGNSGGIEIKARTLEVTDGGYLEANTLGQGDAGKIQITATDKVVFDGESSSGLRSSALSQVGVSGKGKSDGIEINADSVKVTNGALLDASTLGNGNSGLIFINANKQVVFDGESKSGFLSSAISQTTIKNIESNSGGIKIDAGNISITNGAFLDASTFGVGNAGSIEIRASDTVLLDGESKAKTPSPSFVASIVREGAKGKAGDIVINADTLNLTNTGKITAQSLGIGIAGDININVKRNFNANNGQVMTEATQSSGGNVSIKSRRNIILRNNSNIETTLSRTSGSGGNIALDAGVIVALEDSDILAFALEGKGGNITFKNTRAFLSDPLYRPTQPTTDPAVLEQLDGNNLVDVNASGTTPGVISGVPDISFLQNSLAKLPENLIDTSALVASSCVSRSNEKNGTFFITGAESLPYRPGDTVPSRYSAVEVQPLPNNTSNTSQIKPHRRWKIGDPIVEPDRVYRLTNGLRILSRECTW